MIRVYPSSKVKHAPMWRELHRDAPHVFLNARWIKRAEHESDLKENGFKDLWNECQDDIESADAVLVYAEDGDVLKGALVEVGMALANGIRVIIIVSEHNRLAYGTWVHLDSVEWVTSMEDALELLGKWDEELWR